LRYFPEVCEVAIDETAIAEDPLGHLACAIQHGRFVGPLGRTEGRFACRRSQWRAGHPGGRFLLLDHRSSADVPGAGADGLCPFCHAKDGIGGAAVYHSRPFLRNGVRMGGLASRECGSRRDRIHADRWFGPSRERVAGACRDLWALGPLVLPPRACMREQLDHCSGWSNGLVRRAPHGRRGRLDDRTGGRNEPTRRYARFHLVARRQDRPKLYVMAARRNSRSKAKAAKTQR